MKLLQRILFEVKFANCKTANKPCQNLQVAWIVVVQSQVVLEHLIAKSVQMHGNAVPVSASEMLHMKI